MTVAQRKENVDERKMEEERKDAEREKYRKTVGSEVEKMKKENERETVDGERERIKKENWRKTVESG